AGVIKYNEFSITFVIRLCSIITACDPGGIGYCSTNIVRVAFSLAEKSGPASGEAAGRPWPIRDTHRALPGE
ncbi:MAG: hypothetical protein LBB05_04045, partial [Puniceicoccales bacterium]|nr:hypothetical protein [Puniceicoccales bacterium]